MASVAPAPPVAAAHPVIGRSEILEWLRGALGRIRGGKGGLFMLVGESGVGKSTFSSAAAEEARRGGFLVLEGRALPREVPQPFESLKEALHALGPKLSRGPERGEKGGLRALWSPERQAPASMVPLGLMAWRDRGEQEPAAAADPGSTDHLWESLDRVGSGVEGDRLALYDRIFQTMAAAAREQPLLLLLEDVQNADRATLGFLRFLAHHAPGMTLGVLLTATPLESWNGPDRELLESIGREGMLEVQSIRPLVVEEVREYLRFLHAGKDPDEATVTRLFAESEGNPLFLERLALGERGRLPGEGPEGVTVGRALPGSAPSRAPVEGWLLADEVGRKLLVYGALLGREFPFATVARLSDEDEERVALALERLVRREVLDERPDEAYAFHDEGQRQDVLASLTETRQRRLHRRLAEVLEVGGAGPEGEEAWIRELALHFHLGKQDLRSYDYNCRLFEIARHVGKVGEAREALERSLEAVRRIPQPEGDRRDQEREVLLKLGETLTELGELRRAQEQLTAAFQMFLPNEPHELVQIALARSHLLQGRYREARRRLEGVVPPAHEAHPSPAGVEALGLMAECDLAAGRADESLALARRALHIAETLPEVLLLADQLRRMGEVHFHFDVETDRARALYQRALRLYDEGGDPLRRRRLELPLAEVEFARGRSEEGFLRLEGVIDWGDTTGAKLLQAEALLQHAHHALDEGAYDKAGRSIDRARGLVPAEEGPRFEFRYAVLDGRHAQRKGEEETARAHLERAEAIARAAGVPEALHEVLMARAEGAIARGDKVEARSFLTEARAVGIQRPHLVTRTHRLQREIERP